MTSCLEMAGTTVELLDDKGQVLVSCAVELDIEKMVAELKDEPEALVAGIKHFIATNEQSPLSLVLVLNQSSMKWVVFEGTCNPKKHTFKVIKHVAEFDANLRDVRRPPTVALNFVSSAAVASGLPVWIP